MKEYDPVDPRSREHLPEPTGIEEKITGAFIGMIDKKLEDLMRPFKFEVHGGEVPVGVKHLQATDKSSGNLIQFSHVVAQGLDLKTVHLSRSIDRKGGFAHSSLTLSQNSEGERDAWLLKTWSSNRVFSSQLDQIYDSERDFRIVGSKNGRIVGEQESSQLAVNMGLEPGRDCRFIQRGFFESIAEIDRVLRDVSASQIELV